MRPTLVSQFGSEFDQFLYASVEEGGSGAHLSVLSALARLEVDPWQEAANLAQMSRESATQRLASLIDSLPGKSLAHLNCRTVAARLIALLPRQPGITIAPPQIVGGIPTLIHMRPVMYLVIINMIIMAFAFGGQYFIANRRPAGREGSAYALIGKKNTPQVPLPNADRD